MFLVRKEREIRKKSKYIYISRSLAPYGYKI